MVKFKVFAFSVVAVLSLIVSGFCCYTFCFNKVDTNLTIMAESSFDESQIIEREIEIDELGVGLYCQLLYIRDGHYPDFSNDGAYVKLKTTDFLDITSLDLSDVRITIDDTTFKLNTVEELGIFYFPNLVSLDLSANNLTQIKAETFTNMPKLEELNLIGNALTTLEIGELKNIKTIYASNNSLTQVNLGNLASGANVDLSFNQIQDMQKLNLKSDGQGASINLYGNKINNFVEGQFVNYNFIIGFQQEYDLKDYDEHTPIRVYNCGEQDFWLECVNVDTNAVTIITDSANLLPATYDIYLKNNDGYLYNKAIQIKINKSAPTITVVDKDGNILDLYNDFDGQVTIYFDSNDDNYQVQYAINSGNFVSGDSVELQKSGTYTLTVKAVSSLGDESKTVAFTVVIKNNSNGILKLLVVFFCLFILMGVLYLAYMFAFNRKNKIEIVKTDSKKDKTKNNK